MYFLRLLLEIGSKKFNAAIFDKSFQSLAKRCRFEMTFIFHHQFNYLFPRMSQVIRDLEDAINKDINIPPFALSLDVSKEMDILEKMQFLSGML